MKKVWDVIVIGGGPSGMMSAGTAAARGLEVLLLEKNPSLGKKLRITGGGRCNLTNATFDNQTLLAKYQAANKFLFSTFSQYDVQATLDFFHSKDLATKVEAENRVFPTTEKAEDVALVLEKFLHDNKVTIKTEVEVKNIVVEDNQIHHLETTAGDFFAKSFIIATGGNSRPETGSTGDGYRWLKNIGHKINPPTPSLVPLAIKEGWVSKVSGLSIQDTNISVYQDNQLVKKTTGKILFTHGGLSGPGILNLSSFIGKLLIDGAVTLKINTSPTHSDESITDFLKESCVSSSNKKIKNVLGEIIPSALIPIILELANIDIERKCNSLTRNERHLLTSLIRNLPLTIDHLLGADKAIVANGGVDLNEVDFKTMQSKLFTNLYLIGDILDINRPSGGYSLQLCWTTGYVAGSNC